LCCAALCLDAVAADSEAASKLTILKQDSGKNYTDMNLSLYTAISDFNLNGLEWGEAVKFTAPKPGWKLKGVQVVGWSGFNNTTKTFPADRNILVEVRDKDLSLLYKFADTQNNYFMASNGPLYNTIEVPSIPVTGDFYVVFYDRGAMVIGREDYAGTGNSFFFRNGQLEPAEFTVRKTNETMNVNWLIRAVGE